MSRLRSRSFVLLVTVFLAGLALLMLVFGGNAAAQAVPEVNGLFYGDGDAGNYQFLAESPDRARLYYYLEGDTVYLAVVLDRAVNDNVFGDTGDPIDTQYVQSAGWSGGGANHNFRALERSENLELRMTCAAGTIDEAWIHGYLYDQDGDRDPYEEDWLSGPGDDSNGGPPPTQFLLIDTASSLMWNLNNFADMDGSPAWDITLVANGDPPRTTIDTYKSPGGGASDTDVTDEVGYPPVGPITFDAVNGWEWPVVYETSVDISVCAGTPLTVQVISAHNSPPKSGDPDVTIDVYDFGDLPDTYSTTLPALGANHLIQLNGPILGNAIDGEVDGQPTADASGDDVGNSDDEDGIEFDTTNTDWSAGSGELDMTITGGDGCLNVWIDFADDAGVVVDNGDGDFFDSADGISEHIIIGTQVSSSDPQPVNFVFPLPVAINWGTSLAVRARLFPLDEAGGCSPAEGGIGPSGDAIGGEVEDYIIDIPAPTSASLSSFSGDEAGFRLAWTLLGALAVALVIAGALLRRLRTV